MAKTVDMVSRILEGEDPRDVIRQAVDETGDEGVVDEAPTMITKKVVRNGKIVKKKVRKFKKHRILTAAQRRAIKKAQVASQKSGARMQRKKSLRKARTFEDKEEGLDCVNTIICPACGSDAVVTETDPDNNQTICTCPDCGKEFILVDTDVFSPFMDDEDEDDDIELDIPDEWEDDTEGDPSETDDAATDTGETSEGDNLPEGETYFEDENEPLFFTDED